ncbi:hypothetical protein [Microbacterium sp. NPDC086615]|uniref:hypothetical protein n=1 Tax=Microbacterium sp. NPDC086615 TaxID=3154865 RepID=UPI003440E9E7
MSDQGPSKADRERVRAVMGLPPGQRVVQVPNSTLVARLADLTSLHRDFQMARQFISAFADLGRYEVEPDSPNQALWMTAVVMYARAFANGVRHAARPDVTVFDDEDRAAHDYLIAMRNKFIAHSVNAFEQVSPFAVISGEAEETFKVVGVGTQLGMFARMSRAGALRLASLCDIQMTEINGRIEIARNEIKKELTRRGPRYVLGLPELGMVRVDESAVSRSRGNK